MSTALKREVYGRGRGDPVLVESTVDDLGAANFRNLVLLRSTDMGSLAFVFGYCGQAYPTLRYKSTIILPYMLVDKKMLIFEVSCS